ncbi:hypothetical protein C8F04DRAFT_1260556 [Mycena alexandri]|uniref:Uncharacterized protein n=1 Tax=Mycena alexandri TaxID=1745969 RepID=A0AAD6X319_9AGAR|nr:hypothetical protein C8F04DRAFT_1267119 [Mycena alexandri]KAJ7033830.1 hypothetical protein C8F04DRAFT_1260556 [Mycena alexandri]
MFRFEIYLNQSYLECQGTTSGPGRPLSDALSGASAPTAVSRGSWFNRRITAPMFGSAWREPPDRFSRDFHLSLLAVAVQSVVVPAVTPSIEAHVKSLTSTTAKRANLADIY